MSTTTNAVRIHLRARDHLAHVAQALHDEDTDFNVSIEDAEMVLTAVSRFQGSEINGEAVVIERLRTE